MKILRITLAGAVALLAGCQSSGNWIVADRLENLRNANKANLKQVQVDMLRADVERLMGSDKAGGSVVDVLFGRLQHLQATNPMREELVRGSDGVDYKVLFYYTDLRERDNRITDDEMTPVVLREEKVAGVGYGYLGERVEKYKGVR